MSIKTFRTTLIPLLKLSDSKEETLLETMETRDRCEVAIGPANLEGAIITGWDLEEVSTISKPLQFELMGIAH